MNAQMIIKLKVKIKSLAAEASIIRREENKAKKTIRWARSNEARTQEYAAVQLRDSLAEHRRFHLRPEQRCSNLAYGYLRGVPYKRIEQKCHQPPDWARVMNIAERFGGGNVDNELTAWRKTE